MRKLVASMQALLEIIVLILFLAPKTACAQGAVAQSLFDEGKRLLSQGKTEAACEKFAASEQAQPTTGALLNLAACHRKLGKTATAWAEFKKAIPRARADGREDRVAFAEQQADELHSQLSYVTIKTPDSVARLQGVVAILDGQRLPPSSFGIALPIDPGKHDIEVRAPGYASWSKSFTISRRAARSRVTVPALRALEEYVTITVASVPNIDGLTVTIDGRKLEPSEVGQGNKLEPGKHTITASAPGRGSWSKTIVLEADGESYRIDVPELERVKGGGGTTASPVDSSGSYMDSHTSAPAPSRRRSRSSGGNIGRISGMIITGLGMAAAGTGIVFGIVAHNQAQRSLDDRTLCPNFSCTDTGWKHIEAARKNATLATVLIPSGSVAALVGVGLMLFSGSSDHASGPTGATPYVADNEVGLTYGGTF